PSAGRGPLGSPLRCRRGTRLLCARPRSHAARTCRVLARRAGTRAREFDETHERAPGDLAQGARAYGDQWIARLRADPEFLVLSLEFVVHAWRNPELREAFGHRVAAGRLALA